MKRLSIVSKLCKKSIEQGLLIFEELYLNGKKASEAVLRFRWHCSWAYCFYTWRTRRRQECSRWICYCTDNWLTRRKIIISQSIAACKPLGICSPLLDTDEVRRCLIMMIIASARNESSTSDVPNRVYNNDYVVLGLVPFGTQN